jgi:hypothetical protein
MSFRARLTVFFVLIVVVAIGVLMFSLINDSEQGSRCPCRRRGG